MSKTNSLCGEMMPKAKLPGRQSYTDLERKRQWRELREGLIIILGSVSMTLAAVPLFCWLRDHYATLGH